MRDATQVIVRPLLTEKSIWLQRMNKFTFEVAPNATKIEIEKAIETLGRCEGGVEKVNTISVKGKVRRLGRRVGRTSDWKKAIVTLREGVTLGGLLGEAFEQL
jgi:large subunit ribosomal protein L23